MAEKQLLVVGGPNGAGKSTFIASYLIDRPMPYLCADLIATEFPYLDAMSQQVAAGRAFLERIERHLNENDEFVIESTLSGRTLRNFLVRAKAVGFSVTVAFVFLDSADTCVYRVRERVRRGDITYPKRMCAEGFCGAVAISGRSTAKLPINGLCFTMQVAILWKLRSAFPMTLPFRTKGCLIAFKG